MKFALALITGSLFALAGAGLLCGAYLVLRHERRAADARAATTGVVVRLEETVGAQGEGRGYAPVVRFTSDRGQERVHLCREHEPCGLQGWRQGDGAL